MNNLCQVALFTLAMHEVTEQTLSQKASFEERLREELPWFFLPDAIREYAIPRHVSHFERSLKQRARNYSFIQYPDAKTLKKLSKENAQDYVKFSEGKGYQECAIPEKISYIDFLQTNHYHKHDEAIGCHLIHDLEFYEILRTKMIDISKQFEGIFTIRHTGKEINKEELDTQLALFDQLGFIRFSGIVFEKTGMLLNHDWFKSYISEELQKVYPLDLGLSSYVEISKNFTLEISDRINNLDFELTPEEKKSVEISQNIDEDLSSLY